MLYIPRALYPAERSELSNFRDELSRYVPESTLRSLGDMQSMFDIRRDIYLRLHRYDEKSCDWTQLEGIAILYPLKASAVKSVAAGKGDGAIISSESIFRSTSRKPSGYYIGFAWGANKTAQTRLVYALSDFMEENGEKAMKLFAKPTTKQSLNFIKRNGFEVCGAASPPRLLDVCVAKFPLKRKLPRRLVIQRLT